ncbi:hypothetical protein Sjap_015727 [Stephania japonica]|uniref:Transposase n=1 Tax=Stephania japonica TaxID=461633 RepID=A0AAP0IK53_9MAGN
MHLEKLLRFRKALSTTETPSMTMIIKFGTSKHELMDHVYNAFDISSIETLITMTYRHVITHPSGSQYFIPVSLHDETHFELMWSTVANLPLSAKVEIYLTFEPIEPYQNSTVHSQVVEENVGMTCPASMMERLRMQSPIGDVVQDRFVTSIDDNISAPSDDRNEDHDNDIDKDVCPLEDAAPSVNWENINVVTDDPTYEPPGAENLQDDEQFAIDEEEWMEEASDEEDYQPLPVYNEIDWEVANSTATQHSHHSTGWDMPNFELERGMCFDNKKDLQHAIKLWHVNNFCQYLVMESTTTLWALKCEVRGRSWVHVASPCLFAKEETIVGDHSVRRATQVV